MRNCILISNKKDPDLVALYHKVGKKEFANLIKDSLYAITRIGYKGKTKIPEDLLIQSNEYEDIRFVLTITSQKDKDIEALLLNVKKRRLGQFVKQVLRFYIGPAIVLSGYLENDFIKTFEQKVTPVQVFAIGELKSEPVVKTIKRKSKPKAKHTVTKSKENYVSPITMEQPSFPQFTTEDDSNSINTIEHTNTSVGNDEDDVLAMLEGLLS